MQGKSYPEAYLSFIEFIRNDIQDERQKTNRRMLNVFLWCFFLPALTSVGLLLLVNAGVLPRAMRSYVGWIVLIFPIAYSLYVVSSEVLSQVPAAFRKGSVAHSLGQAIQGAQWRERVLESMRRRAEIGPSQWDFIVASFRMDLEAMQYRIRYLTALAGAVFFLIMQGIDSLGDPERVTWVKSPMGWFQESSNDLSQFVGLALFLVLLYLSGNQNHHSLSRYLNCAELLKLDWEKEERLKSRREPVA